MFGNIARIASRPAAAAAAASVAANVAQGPAQARAPPQGARQALQHPPAHSKIVDRDTEGWVLAEMKDELVVFQPFTQKEVDEAASTVMALWSGSALGSPSSAPIVTEPGEDAFEGRSMSSSSGGSTDGSDDGLADAVIEAAAAANADAVVIGRKRDRDQLESLMAITTRLLRRPGMQREVVTCMMEDPEVRELMLRQCDDLDRYLIAAGIPTPHLLPAPENAASGVSIEEIGSSSSSSSAGAGAGAAPQAGGPSLVSRVVGAVAGALGRAGNALASLGDWLRRHLAAAFPADGETRAADGGADAVDAGDGGESRGQHRVNQVLGGVMVLAVAVFCVAVIRRPLVLRALARR